jgi:hypothetical protein
LNNQEGGGEGCWWKNTNNGLKHQQYCNYQLPLSADGMLIPQQRQAFFVVSHFYSKLKNQVLASVPFRLEMGTSIPFFKTK